MVRHSFTTGTQVPDAWTAAKATLLDKNGNVISHDHGLEYSLTPNGTLLTNDAPFAIKHPALAKIARGAGMTGLALSALSPTLAHAETGEPQYFIVLANTAGAGGSEWRSELLLNDVSGNGSSGRILLKPAGQSTPDANAMSTPYTINKRGAITADPLATIGFTGACTVKILPDAGQQSPGASARIWNQVSDGQQLSQSSSPLVKADFLQAGDVAYFTLPKDRDAVRFNLFALGETINSPFFVRPQTPQVDFGLFDQYGQPISGTVKDLLDNGLLQYAPATNVLFGRNPGNNDVLRAQVNGGLVALLGSAAQNFGSKGDAGNGTPVVDKLLREGYIRLAPKNAEQNDPYHLEVYAKVRDGGRVKMFGVDLDGNDSIDYVVTNEKDGSEYYYKESGPLGIAPGTYTPKLLLTLEDEQGGTFDRVMQGEPFTVVAEKNGYVANYDNAKTFIMNNLDRVSTWASHGVYGGGVFTSDVWKAAWIKYFDGVYVPGSNPEIVKMTFNDSGDTMTGNDVLMEVQGGSIQSILGMPEEEFDELRNAVKAELP